MARLRNRRLEKRRTGVGSIRTKTASQRVKESDSFLTFFSVIFVAVISVCYVFQINSMATSGYELEEYEEKLQTLKNDFRNMKNEEANLRLLNNLETEKKKLSAITSSDIDYLTSSGTSVAMKE
ncbi:MAG: hypothetical protein PHI66_05215 [Candidatus Pacebacteria bacterium]|nr:hypothetical protein [Candidatus Paceibacterota bacterium]